MFNLRDKTDEELRNIMYSCMCTLSLCGAYGEDTPKERLLNDCGHELERRDMLRQNRQTDIITGIKIC